MAGVSVVAVGLLQPASSSAAHSGKGSSFFMWQRSGRIGNGGGAYFEQRVPGADSFRSWRLLVTRFGTPAPGPAPEGMRVPPSAEVWRRIVAALKAANAADPGANHVYDDGPDLGWQRRYPLGIW